MKKLQVLVSTMNNKYSLVEEMGIASDCVIVNQCDQDGRSCFDINGHNVKWIDSNQRGLSRSRNLALMNSDADICLIADDDLIYVGDYQKKILDCFEKEQGYSLIVFIVEGINKVFKKYSPRERELNFFTAMQVSSVQIAFRRQCLISNGIFFREDFGAGAKYPMGEENILLSECLRHGLRIKYVPIKIANLYMGDSSWFKGYDQKYLYSQGAIYSAMSERVYLLLIILFAVRKRKIFNKGIGLFDSIRYMLNGARDYFSTKDSLRNRR